MSLHIDGLRYAYDDRHPERGLQQLSETLAPGRLVAVLGENGSGKSTLLKCLAGVLTPDAGELHWHGRALSAMTRGERARLLGYLAQRNHPAWTMTARDLVRYGTLARPDFSATQATLAVEKALHATDAAHLADRLITAISAGELQRVLLARVLAGEPQMLLADEPATGLDPRHQRQVMRLLQRYAHQGALVVVVSHDLQAAWDWCDDVLVLQEGKLVAAGPTRGTLQADLVDAVFGVPVPFLEKA